MSHHNKNHELILKFLSRTDEDSDGIADAMKATIAQFILRTHHDMYILTSTGCDHMSIVQLCDLQIRHLRGCIVSLQASSNLAHPLLQGELLQ